MVLSESIIGRARKKRGLLDIECVNIRDYTEDKHKTGRRLSIRRRELGMVMQTQPIYDCYKSICASQGKKLHLIYMTPQGKTLTQERVKELAQTDGFVILCGHYEGVG